MASWRDHNFLGKEEIMEKRVLLLFDSRCAMCRFFSAIVDFISRISGKKIRILSIHNRNCRRFLDREFGQGMAPFSLYFIDGESIYWGKNASVRISEYLGFSYHVTMIFYAIYPTLNKLANLTRRHKCAGCDQNESGQRRLKYQPLRL